MTALIITLSSIFSLSLLIFLLYILLFVRPRARRPENESLLSDYAHRGLHGRGVPENSLKAFELAYNLVRSDTVGSYYLCHNAERYGVTAGIIIEGGEVIIGAYRA